MVGGFNPSEKKKVWKLLYHEFSLIEAKGYHQEFQVPKMEAFLNLISSYFGGGFSLT